MRNLEIRFNNLSKFGKKKKVKKAISPFKKFEEVSGWKLRPAVQVLALALISLMKSSETM